MNAYWPEGMPRHLDHTHATIADLVEGMAARYGDRAAVVDGELTLSYTELYDEACAVARGLQREGIGPGDVVLLHLPNTARFLAAYYGVLLSGATVSPVNPLTPVPGLVSQIKDTSARMAVSHPANVDNLLAAAEELAAGDHSMDIVLVECTSGAPDPEGDPVVGSQSVRAWSTLLDRDGQGRPDATFDRDDVAHIVYTGGTTGTPKGVRVLHRNVVANVSQMIAWRAGHGLRVSDRRLELDPFPVTGEPGVVVGEGATVVVSPLFHAHALINSSFLLGAGLTLVIAGRFNPAAMLDLVERHAVSYITGSPTMWHALVREPTAGERDLSSVRVVSSGAAPIDPVTLDQLAAVFPNAVVTEGYGLTEGTCLVTALPPFSTAPRVIGSVGVPVPDTEIEIRDGEGRALPVGERGEIWVRGPQVTDGYLNLPGETAGQFVDGWLATGDIAYVDDEGMVRIADRAKDMLIYKGYNVYPRELEDLLAGHPQVDRAAVVGRDHEAFGQEPVAFVVPTAGEQPTADEIKDWVAERVLPYKKLRAVQIVGSLPTSTAGKLLKNELRPLVMPR